MDIELKIKIKPVFVPNFLITEGIPGKRQDGFSANEHIDIKDLSDEQLEIVAMRWREDLLANAKKRREGR